MQSIMDFEFTGDNFSEISNAPWKWQDWGWGSECCDRISPVVHQEVTTRYKWGVKLEHVWEVDNYETQSWDREIILDSIAQENLMNE